MAGVVAASDSQNDATGEAAPASDSRASVEATNDLAKLQSLIAAERARADAAEKRANQAEKQSRVSTKTADERIAALEAKAADAERKLALAAAVDAAVANVGDGYTVDAALVRRQAELFRPDADIAGAVADLVSALRRPVAVQPGTTATPKAADVTVKDATKMTPAELAALQRSDPAAFAAAVEAIREAAAFPTTPTLTSPSLVRAGGAGATR